MDASQQFGSQPVSYGTSALSSGPQSQKKQTYNPEKVIESLGTKFLVRTGKTLSFTAQSAKVLETFHRKFEKAQASNDETLKEAFVRAVINLKNKVMEIKDHKNQKHSDGMGHVFHIDVHSKMTKLFDLLPEEFTWAPSADSEADTSTAQPDASAVDSAAPALPQQPYAYHLQSPHGHGSQVEHVPSRPMPAPGQPFYAQSQYASSVSMGAHGQPLYAQPQHALSVPWLVSSEQQFQPQLQHVQSRPMPEASAPNPQQQWAVIAGLMKQGKSVDTWFLDLQGSLQFSDEIKGFLKISTQKLAVLNEYQPGHFGQFEFIQGLAPKIFTLIATAKQSIAQTYGIPVKDVLLEENSQQTINAFQTVLGKKQQAFDAL